MSKVPGGTGKEKKKSLPKSRENVKENSPIESKTNTMSHSL